MTLRSVIILVGVTISIAASGCRGPVEQGPPPVTGSSPPPREDDPIHRAPAAPPVTRRPFRIVQPAAGEVLRLPDASRHRGVVIRTDPEASVRAACDGEIVLITESYPGLGPAIVIDHAGGYRTVYGPVRANKGLGESTRVRRGEVIGRLADPAALLRFRLMRGGVDVPNLFELAEFESAGTLGEDEHALPH